MALTDLGMAEFFVVAAERALAGGDHDAALRLARHAQARLDTALAPTIESANREAEATAEFYRRVLS